MHVPGLQYFPTKSLYEASDSPNQRDTIYQQAFTYNSEVQLIPGSKKIYLNIPLNKLIGPDEVDNPDKKFNSILVSGYLSYSGDINNSFVLKFVHSFVTDWNIYSINEPISYDSDLQNYFFPLQPENTSNAWSPQGLAENWVNGSSNVINGLWDDNDTGYTPIGWSCKAGGVTSSGGTGPTGGVDVNSFPPFTPSTSQRYLFVECTGFNTDYVMITRTPGVNYSQAMLGNTSNDLKLKFYVHGYSTDYSQMGDLEVYISPNFPTNKVGSTLLWTVTPPGGGGDSSYNQITSASPYQEISISLNAYREVNDTHYIYFVSKRTSGFRGDIAIDGVQIIEEGDDNLNFEANFSYQLSPEEGEGGTPNVGDSVLISNNNIDFTDTNIRFIVTPPEGKEIYIKGSYLLM